MERIKLQAGKTMKTIYRLTAGVETRHYSDGWSENWERDSACDTADFDDYNVARAAYDECGCEWPGREDEREFCELMRIVRLFNDDSEWEDTDDYEIVLFKYADADDWDAKHPDWAVVVREIDEFGGVVSDSDVEYYGTDYLRALDEFNHRDAALAYVNRDSPDCVRLQIALVPTFHNLDSWDCKVKEFAPDGYRDIVYTLVTLHRETLAKGKWTESVEPLYFKFRNASDGWDFYDDLRNTRKLQAAYLAWSGDELNRKRIRVTVREHVDWQAYRANSGNGPVISEVIYNLDSLMIDYVHDNRVN